MEPCQAQPRSSGKDKPACPDETYGWLPLCESKSTTMSVEFLIQPFLQHKKWGALTVLLQHFGCKNQTGSKLEVPIAVYQQAILFNWCSKSCSNCYFHLCVYACFLQRASFQLASISFKKLHFKSIQIQYFCRNLCTTPPPINQLFPAENPWKTFSNPNFGRLGRSPQESNSPNPPTNSQNPQGGK